MSNIRISQSKHMLLLLTNSHAINQYSIEDPFVSQLQPHSPDHNNFWIPSLNLAQEVSIWLFFRYLIKAVLYRTIKPN